MLIMKNSNNTHSTNMKMKKNLIFYHFVMILSLLTLLSRCFLDTYTDRRIDRRVKRE